MNAEELVKVITEAEKDGYVVLDTIGGLQKKNIATLCKQQAHGLLYDLNRDKGTCLALIDKPTWINNYACSVVIKYLKGRIEQLETKLKHYETKN